MTTTIMRDSVIGDAWVQEAMTANPVRPILDDSGNPTGNFLTCPVRLTFCDLFHKGTKQDDNGATVESNYGCTALFPPGADLSVLVQAHFEKNYQEFPDRYDQATNSFAGLHTPWRDQREKMNFSGYTPGAYFMSLSTNYKPQIVDPRMNPIVDEGRVYSGVWAILAINPYVFGKAPPRPKKGVSFGLQSVMIIADDTPLSGGAPDPKSQFGGVQVKAPGVNPAANFGQPQAPGMPPAGTMPHGTMTTPPPPPQAPGMPPAGTMPSAAPVGTACFMCGNMNPAGAVACVHCHTPLA